MLSNRYLSLGVSMGVINPEWRTLALEIRSKNTLGGKSRPKRVGRILRDLKFISDETHRGILAEQKGHKRRQLSRIGRLLPWNAPQNGQRILLVGTSVVALLLLVFGLNVSLGDMLPYWSVLSSAFNTIFEKRQGRSIQSALKHGALLFL